MSDPKEPSEELKACPFCGGIAKIFTDSSSQWYATCVDETGTCYGVVECDGEFGDTAKSVGTKEDAISFWNRRPEPERDLTLDKSYSEKMKAVRAKLGAMGHFEQEVILVELLNEIGFPLVAKEFEDEFGEG